MISSKELVSCVPYVNNPSIVTVTIHNGLYNVLSRRVAEDLYEVFLALAEEKGVRVAVITGHGEKAFMSGADINEFTGLDSETARPYLETIHKAMNRIESSAFPVIACINGYALGGGCELALACDIRVAVSGAIIGLPEVDLGVIPAGGGTQRLIRTIGIGHAKELLYTAKKLTAEEALQIGLVNHVVGKPEMVAFTMELAESIARNAPTSVSFAKRLSNCGLDMPLADALELEKELGAQCYATQDCKEGVSAFFDKRVPVFPGI